MKLSEFLSRSRVAPRTLTAAVVVAVVASLSAATGSAASGATGQVRPAAQPSPKPLHTSFVSKKVAAGKADIDLRKLKVVHPEPKEFPLGVRGGSSSPPAGVRAPSSGTAALQRNTDRTLAAAAGTTPTEFSTPNPNFDGITGTGTPPDANGDVGPNHIIEIQNSTFQVFNKQGTTLAGPSAISSIWSAAGFTGNCANRNDGDPVVKYDPLADRWVISQFSIPNGFQGANIDFCVAVSQTANPVTGGFFAYAFAIPVPGTIGGFDYPKIGVWPDAYYASSQEGFSGGNLDVYALDRANMLNGNPATLQMIQVAGPALILLPGDIDGTPPPTGTPAPFARAIDGNLWGGSDRVEIYRFHVDWGVTANTTFTLDASLNTAGFDSNLCNGTNLFDNCVPQPGTTQLLETLPHWSMGPLQYRDFGSYETLVFGHTVDADGADHAAMRWYELRRTGGSGGAWAINQQSTYSPDAGTPGLADDPHRWMGSVAMDKAGDMALGYSVSSSTVNPGLSYTGRQAGDPSGLMPAGEFSLVTGGGTQATNRWGDYASMVVDPVDGCTFWYTGEYISASGRRTRIGSFRFPTCNRSDLEIAKSGPSTVNAGDQATYTVRVTNHGPDDAFGVRVTDTLPAGTTYVSDTGGCTFSPGTGPGGRDQLQCALGTIGNGQSKTFTVRVTVPADLVAGSGTGTITNDATVTSDWTDPNPANNAASAGTTVQESADLKVTKLCKPDGVLDAGQIGTCTVFVDNFGPSAARNVTLTDANVSNEPFTFGTITPSQGGCDPPAAGTVTCHLGTVAAASPSNPGRATVAIQVKATEQTDINDLAGVVSATPDPDHGNNQATGSLSVRAVADLALTKTASPSPLTSGTQLTFALGVTNNGPSTSRNVVVTDPIEAGLTILSITAPGGTCNQGTPGDPARPTLCHFDSIAPGATKTVTIVVNVDPGSHNTVRNDARVTSGTFDPNSVNDLASTTTAVRVADLKITKTSDFDTYKPLSTVKYSVTVNNFGPGDATGVVVTDKLPDPKQAVYVSDTAGCVKNNTTLTLNCNLGTIPATQSRTFTITVKIKALKGTVTNTASVAAATSDPVPGNNTSTRVVTIKLI
jgi:uncharacterized repeat protein (TIGR01451 family)